MKRKDADRPSNANAKRIWRSLSKAGQAAKSGLSGKPRHFRKRGQGGIYWTSHGAASPQELAAEVEAQLGLRIAGSDWFKDGIIVNLRDGSRRIVWGKEIDCKDPPYTPLSAASQ